MDYAVMEPASMEGGATSGGASGGGEGGQVLAVPMELTWLDVGSWPAFAQTCGKDDAGNVLGQARHVLTDTCGTLMVSSDPDHLIAAIGCQDMVIIHTSDATLVCPADRAEDIKKLYAKLAAESGDKWL